MSREYPEDEDLDKIESWDVVKDTQGLIDFIKSLWRWEEPYFQFEKDDREWRLELHTGGWSGNEELVGALKTNSMFWLLYWQKSERGGHYWFKGDIKK